MNGHINLSVKESIKNNCNIFNVLRAASYNSIIHYSLDIGLVREGDCADFIVVDNLTDFRVLQTYCNGEKIAENGVSFIKPQPPSIINIFNANKITSDQLLIKSTSSGPDNRMVLVNVIATKPTSIITQIENHPLKVVNNEILPDPTKDIAKLTLLNRYSPSKPVLCFVRGLNLVDIAIASSVSHDSHNIIAAGSNDELLCRAINEVIDVKGGISVAFGDKVKILELPIGGLISDLPIAEVNKIHLELLRLLKQPLNENWNPFMTLSFLSLLVIPDIKLSPKGLYRVMKDSFIGIEH
jgi:adenine deaminase